MSSRQRTAWDAENRLAAVNNGALRTEFTYDGLSRRVRIVEKNNGATTSETEFLWCGEAICEQRDSTGANTTARYFPQGEQQGTDSFFYTRDHLGSVRELTDTTANIRARYDYDPYGRTTKLSGDRDAAFSYTGHYAHTPSGLLLTHYRAYDPNEGRWLSEDPSRLAGGPNLYEYVSNQPGESWDPFGLSDHSYDRWDFLLDTANVSNGALNAIIPGLDDFIRNNYSGGDLINPCSTTYRAGWLLGMGLSIAAGLGELGGAAEEASVATRGIGKYGGIFSKSSNAAGGDVCVVFA